MLDIKFIRENADKVRQGVKNKNLNPDVVDNILSLDEKRRSLMGEIQELRTKRNDINENLKKERTEILIKETT